MTTPWPMSRGPVWVTGRISTTTTRSSSPMTRCAARAGGCSRRCCATGPRGVFQGKILVKPGAQKTRWLPDQQSLLLDEASQFLARPELEIYADDVACSHGSHFGPPSAATRCIICAARGIPEGIAQDLLTLAFVAEALEEIEDEAMPRRLRTRLSQWLERRRERKQA